jgi:hypothetical protein
MLAKCPKCEKIMPHIEGVPKDVHVGGRPAFAGTFFCCPLCHTAISAGVDPVAVKVDITNKLTREMKKLRP